MCIRDRFDTSHHVSENYNSQFSSLNLFQNLVINSITILSRSDSVSYTHLDVYKRQEQVRAIKDSLLREDSAAKIVIMGDMNDDPMDKSMAVALGAKRKRCV